MSYWHMEDRPYTTWQLVKSYWQSEERLSAYLFFIGALLLTLFLVGLEVAITDWYNFFYDSLQEYDKRSAIELLWVFIFIATLYIVFAVYRYYIQNYLALTWRRWLTKQFVARWLAGRSYYYLENFDQHTDNPDQRIQEDVGSLVSISLELVLGLFSSVVTFFAFIYILWKLSGTITIPLGHFGIFHVPGYLVWVSIIYALVGSLLTLKIGRPLVKLNFEQQRREANFRYAAVDLRVHSENIALYRGEDHQKSVLNRLLDSLLENWYMIILRQKLLLWFTAGYGQVSVLVPIVVALPNYFNKVFKLGGWIQTLAAFTRIQDALSFLVNSYSRIAEWQAVAQRLITFLDHMYDVGQETHAKDHFNFMQTPQNNIVAKNLTIYTPQNQMLLENINQEFIHGQNYLIKGMSGIGKSTFVRTLAGIWPYGSGDISLPEKKHIMFMPQRNYMPIGTLREAIMFPDKILPVSDAELSKLLQDCGLPALKDMLNETKTWADSLSPGELQRIAFVRVLIHKPDWVLLDESTSMLDLENEKRLYAVMKSHLPQCSFISVGHRPSLAAYHDHEIDMADYSVEREPA